MTAQLEEQQDSKIQEMAERITTVFNDTFSALIERRDKAYQDGIASLDAEREALEREHASIATAATDLELLLPATARVAQAEADRLTVSGQMEAARAKLAEVTEAEQIPAAMRERQAATAVRCEEIEGEKRTVARDVFQKWFTELLPVVRATEHGLFITLLDGLQTSCYEYQTQTETRVIDVLGNTFQSLTAGEKSQEWIAGQRWYRGRG